MSETTKVTAATITSGTTSEASNGTTSEASNGKTRDNTPMVLYTTKEECLANEPAKCKEANAKKEGTWKPICITRPESFDGEKQVWVWAVGHVNALAVVSGMDGYSASTGERGPRKPVDKGAVVTDAFSHWTADQLKSAGLSQPIIDAILASRKVDAEKTTNHPANKAAIEANKAATAKGRKK